VESVPRFSNAVGFIDTRLGHIDRGCPAHANGKLGESIPPAKPGAWSFYIFQRLFWDLRVSVVILESVCLVYN
jgi:hypothetical protein